MLKKLVRKHSILVVLIVAGLIIFHLVMWSWLNYEFTMNKKEEPSPCAALASGPLSQNPASTVLRSSLQASGSGWESYALDFFCGPISSGLSAGSSVLKDLPGDAKLVVGWEGAISTFTGLHVDTWLSLDAPEPKEGSNIFGIIKTGDDPSVSSKLLNISLSVTSRHLYLNFWFHNMRMTTSEWHVGYVIYYVTNTTLPDSSAPPLPLQQGLHSGVLLQEPTNILASTPLTLACRGADFAEEAGVARSTNG